MKTVYAIICEYGAGSIHESVEMICANRKIAQAWFDKADFYGRPVRIEEMTIVDGWPNDTKVKK